METNGRVFLVTGASKGIGLATVLVALDAGYTVVGTSRNAEALTATIAEKAPNHAERFLAVSMPFTTEGIQQAIDTIHDTFGRIDVLVNNAGYAILGAVEEFSIDEVKANFDVNVFGLLQVTQAVLPIMRAQRTGHIINIASISGTVTGPAQGIYSATKAAVIMLSEALADEVSDFGIQVTAVCPAGVRTDFLDDRSMKRPAKQIAEYHTVAQTMQGLGQLNHNQSGNPTKVAAALVELAGMEQAPGRLYLGYGALRGLQAKANAVIQEAAAHQQLSMSIDD